MKQFTYVNNYIDIILVFANYYIADKSNKIRTHVFVSKFGCLEDSVIGSTNNLTMVLHSEESTSGW